MPVSKRTQEENRRQEKNQKQTTWNATQYKKYRSSGLCVSCGKLKDTSTSRCSVCRQKAILYNNERKRKYTNEGRCRDCGGEAQLTNRSLRKRERGNYCKNCWLKVLASSTLGSRKHWKTLVEKLDAYEWKCAYTKKPLILGVNLSFDHVNPVCRFPEQKHDPNNIVPCDWQVNLMKRDLTREEFLTLVNDVHLNSSR